MKTGVIIENRLERVEIIDKQPFQSFRKNDASSLLETPYIVKHVGQQRETET